MKIGFECIPCFLKQSLEAAEMASDDKNIHTKIIKKVLEKLGTISFDTYSPPELSREIHEIIRNITKSKDPYKKVKDQSNEIAKKHYPYLKKLLKEVKDPLLLSIKLAIVGNVIDFGTSNRFDLGEMIETAVNKDFAAEDYPLFQKMLNQSKTILYIADNTGEIFFDKLLLEELVKRNKKITYVVKANPIINDATVEDAVFTGIDKLATVIEGDAGQNASAPGISIKLASDEFINYFHSSDMIISKGQGNYESLNSCNREIFFLLMIKCPLVAKDVGTEMGKLVLKAKSNN